MPPLSPAQKAERAKRRKELEAERERERAARSAEYERAAQEAERERAAQMTMLKYSPYWEKYRTGELSLGEAVGRARRARERDDRDAVLKAQAEALAKAIRKAREG